MPIEIKGASFSNNSLSAQNKMNITDGLVSLNQNLN